MFKTLKTIFAEMKNLYLRIILLGCFSFLQTTFLLSQKISFTKEDEKWADEMMTKMTLNEKIGQLFILNLYPTKEDEPRKNKIIETIKNYNLGGVILMKGDYNMASHIVQELQGIAKVPMFISIDGEWGINMRIANTIKYPYQLTLGAIQNDSLLFQMGKSVARECKSLGININFAPVVDININPRNPVINFRSFGENKYKVTNKGLQYALGMQSEGVMACLKHFPGHGDTDVDSHEDLPYINKSLSKLEEMELFPFKELIKNNVWSVMTAHLNVPALDNTNTPTSISKPTIDGYLKKQLNFQGLIITDALNMKGLTKNSVAGETELKAYKAGNDILEFTENFEAAMNQIEAYITESDENFEEFHQRIRKILLFKSKMKLKDYKLNKPNPLYNTTSPENPHYVLNQRLYDESTTFLSSDYAVLSKVRNPETKILFVSIGDATTTLKTKLNSNPNYRFEFIPKKSSAKAYDDIIKKSDNFDLVILSFHGLSQYAKSNFGLDMTQINFIDEINEKSNILNLWFGNPYGLKYFQNANHVLLAYEDNSFTHQSVYKYLTQPLMIPGKIPVTVGKFKEGGQRIEAYKSETTPVPTLEDTTKVDTTALNNSPVSEFDIDALCYEMLENGVTPGCQVVVWHKGKEVYNKAFGHHSYSISSQKVQKDDIYDLASMTKILSTTLAAMRLKEYDMLSTEKRVSDYLDLDSSATIHYTTIRQLLTHEAGLTPFIPFYKRFNDSNFYQFFSTLPMANRTTKVCENMYLTDSYKDSMWYEMCHRSLSGVGSYKYSDLSMYILQKIIEKNSKISLDTFVAEAFYKPLKVGLTYRPLEKYPLYKIAPTEYDETFRRQLVQGYVHDQGCALYGGVAGHAGLFGSAQDVAVVMQMLMNGGKYKGKKYFDKNTIVLFTNYQGSGSRRGYGFDKPNYENRAKSPTAPECSFSTFGHTGFTGTCAWADPENEIVFVFLSNRIHPSAENKKINSGNYRERLQSLFYRWLKK